MGLWVMNADGTDQRFVYAYEGPVVEDAPVWSPDGKLIALTLLKEGDYDVWVVPSGGGEAVNVSNLPGDDTGISWSPDSTALTFTNETEEGLWQIVAAADGSSTYPLMPGEITGYGAWSPVAEPAIAGIDDPAP